MDVDSEAHKKGVQAHSVKCLFVCVRLQLKSSVWPNIPLFVKNSLIVNKKPRNVKRRLSQDMYSKPMYQLQCYNSVTKMDFLGVHVTNRHADEQEKKSHAMHHGHSQ